MTTILDGCLREQIQCRRVHRYIMLQCRRHGICRDWRAYPHTRSWLEVEECVRFALEHDAFMRGVPYKRYDG